MQISVTITALDDGDKPPADLNAVAEKVGKALNYRKTKDQVFVSVVGHAGTETMQPEDLAPPPEEEGE